MAVILSHATALQALRRGARLAPTTSDGAPSAPGWSVRRGDKLAETRAAHRLLLETHLLDKGQPLHVIAQPGEPRTRYRPLVIHRWTTARPLPVRQLDHGLWTVSPELLFVQLSAELALPQAVLLGWELCGRYGKVLPGDRRCRLVERGFEDRAALTTVAGITAFLAAHPRLRGVRPAREALTWVRDRARSPMEAAVWMLLCMPPRLGGFGLPPFQVNYRIPLNPRDAALLDRPYLELDLWHPDPPLDVEVDGSDHDRTRVHDAVRNNELAARHVRQIHLAGPELMNCDRFEDEARTIAQILGVRLRLECADWRARYVRLHAAVMNIELNEVPLEAYDEL